MNLSWIPQLAEASSWLDGVGGLAGSAIATRAARAKRSVAVAVATEHGTTLLATKSNLPVVGQTPAAELTIGHKAEECARSSEL